MANITYQVEPELSVEQFVDLLRRSTLAERRPVKDLPRIARMLAGADCIVTARTSAGELVGVSRAISDGTYCTYLSDLAVDERFQKQGIGRALIQRTREEAGPDASLILLAAPKARSYYGHVGMQAHPSCWILNEGETLTSKSEPPIAVSNDEELEPASSAAKNQSSNSGDALSKFFDSISEEYAGAIRRCVPRYDEMFWAIFAYLPQRLRRPQRILDLGCGTGNLSVAIRDHFPNAELTAVDLSEASLAACRDRVGTTRTQFLAGDMRTLELPREEFDLVLSTIALHHLTSTEKAELFQRCHQWLKPGGVFSFSDQFAGATAELYETHIQHWRAATQVAGAAQEEWEMWMAHQNDQDFHDSLGSQLRWLAEAGFIDIDCVWRHLLWTVLTASKPA